MNTKLELFEELKTRLQKLRIAGKLSKEKQQATIDHIRGSLSDGDTELRSYLAMDDEDLTGMK